MRIEQLEHLAAVARAGSFRRAAEQLHISQPALSSSVRSLEKELGVDILERGRHGARVSDPGRDLLPHLLTVLDSYDALRQAASSEHAGTRLIRLGTVSTAATPLLTPAIRQLRERHPATQVEVVAAQQAGIAQGLLDGSIDLGLVNFLEGDDLPTELHATPLLRGRPVICMRPDSPLADYAGVRVSELRAEPLIAMRPGYVMHRFLHRLLRDRVPVFACAADGAEMGKLMVAEGLGVTILPDFSVIGDPLERSGRITWRPLADDHTSVRLVILRARSGSPSRAAQDLHQILVRRARDYMNSASRPSA